MKSRFEEWSQNFVIAVVALAIAAVVAALTWRVVVWILP